MVRGEELLQQLDKARRKQDAEAIMSFIAMVERHMAAHAQSYNSPYLEQRRRELAQEYVQQQAMHGEISRQAPSATTPAAARAAAAEAALMPPASATVVAAKASVEATAVAAGGSPF